MSITIIDPIGTLEKRLTALVAEEYPRSNCIRLSVERTFEGKEKIFCCFNHGQRSHRVRCEYNPLDVQSSHDSVLRNKLRAIRPDVLG